MLLGFRLKLGHALQLAHVGVAVEDPAQLRVAGYVGLDEQDVYKRQSSWRAKIQRNQQMPERLKGR